MNAPEEELELEALALAIREDAPQPDPAFARELGRRVDEGFARPRRFRLPRRTIRMPRAKLPLLAGVAATLIALVVAVGVLSGSEQNQSAQSGELAQQPSPVVEPAIPLQDSSGGTAPEPATAAPARRVERSAELTIAASADELQPMSDRVGQVAEEHGGYVVSSHISTGPGSSPGGTFVLRIPTDRLETALGELGKLGKVMARSESSQDMTAPYKGTQNRLGDLLLERRATQDRLRGAKGSERLRLRSRLRQINAEIGALHNRIDDLRRRTVFSTVTVTLEQQRASGGGGGGGSGPGGAWHDALGTLADILAFAIRALGVVLPLGLMAVLGWLGAGILRRRRREAALF